MLAVHSVSVWCRSKHYHSPQFYRFPTHQAKDLADTIVNISPASDDSIAALDIPADLAAVMKKRDGGHYVFDYKLYSTSEIATKKVRQIAFDPSCHLCSIFLASVFTGW